MSAPHISPFTSDLWALDALPAEEKTRVEQHLAACASCQAAATAAAESRAHFARYIAPRGAPALARARRWWPTWLLAPALAAALLLLVPWFRPRGASDDLGIKGGPAFSTFVRHAGQVAPLVDGATLRAGDSLRFVVVSGELPYLLIVSLDGAGHPNVYYPFDGTASARIATRTRVEVPGSIVLDDAPGPERLFALFSSAPIAAADATAALSALGKDGVRATTRLPIAVGAQRSVLFEKSQ